MARRRVLVAIVPPPRITAGCRVLRRMLGDDRPERIVPHITVVPPVNIEPDAYRAVRRHLRRVAAAARPFSLTIEGVASFHPGTPTIHLAVSDSAVGELGSLRSALLQGPLARQDPRPYRPHVTLRERVPEPVIDEALRLFSQASFSWTGPQAWQVGSLHLMEQFRSEELGTHWRSVAEEVLGPVTVVGRGGIELVLHSSSLIEPEVASLLGPVELDLSDEATLLCVSAEEPRRAGRPLGVVLGEVSSRGARIEAALVAETNRGIGMARHLIARWCHLAASEGAELAWARDRPGAEFLAALGFSALGGFWVRDLG